MNVTTLYTTVAVIMLGIILIVPVSGVYAQTNTDKLDEVVEAVRQIVSGIAGLGETISSGFTSILAGQTDIRQDIADLHDWLTEEIPVRDSSSTDLLISNLVNQVDDLAESIDNDAILDGIDDIRQDIADIDIDTGIEVDFSDDIRPDAILQILGDIDRTLDVIQVEMRIMQNQLAAIEQDVHSHNTTAGTVSPSPAPVPATSTTDTPKETRAPVLSGTRLYTDTIQYDVSTIRQGSVTPEATTRYTLDITLDCIDRVYIRTISIEDVAEEMAAGTGQRDPRNSVIVFDENEEELYTIYNSKFDTGREKTVLHRTYEAAGRTMDHDETWTIRSTVHHIDTKGPNLETPANDTSLYILKVEYQAWTTDADCTIGGTTADGEELIPAETTIRRLLYSADVKGDSILSEYTSTVSCDGQYRIVSAIPHTAKEIVELRQFYTMSISSGDYESTVDIDTGTLDTAMEYTTRDSTISGDIPTPDNDIQAVLVDIQYEAAKAVTCDISS